MSKFIKGILSIAILISFSHKASALKVCIDPGHSAYDISNSGPVFTDLGKWREDLCNVERG
jgi:hypothetical protein